MFAFNHSLIKIGQGLVLSIIPSNIKFVVISRQTLVKKFNSKAESIKEDILFSLRKFKSVCITIDAGIINGIPILDVTVVHPFSGVEPLLYRAFRNFSGTTEDYKGKVKDAILDHKEKDLNVTSIVGDNLITQKTAFDGGLNSMQFNNMGTIFSKPMWVSCLCHTLSLMPDDVIAEIDRIE